MYTVLCAPGSIVMKMYLNNWTRHEKACAAQHSLTQQDKFMAGSRGFCRERSERATALTLEPLPLGVPPASRIGRDGRVRLAAVGVWGLAPMSRR